MCVLQYYNNRYVPNIMGNDWHKFGIQATIQGDCCNLYRLTFGAKGGPATNTCGMYMYSEILAVQDAELYYDKATQTALGYLKQDSMDGWTEGGTWFSYNDKNSIKAVTQYISKYMYIIQHVLKQQAKNDFGSMHFCLFVCLLSYI